MLKDKYPQFNYADFKTDQDEFYKKLKSQFLRDEEYKLIDEVRKNVKVTRKILDHKVSENQMIGYKFLNEFWEQEFDKLVPPGTSSTVIINSLSFIDPLMVPLFEEAEKKALSSTCKFNSVIRCAAFCEILYTKKYILQTKTNIITMNEFAKSRYGIDIKNALAATNNAGRENHKTRSVKKMIPLKNCF